MSGSLDLRPALDHPELLAPAVAAELRDLRDRAAGVDVAPIDATLADTAAFCTAYGVGLRRLGELRGRRLPRVIVGSGIRGSKIELPGAVLAALPRAPVVDGLAIARDG
jgi:hypothetical protein